MLYHAPKAFLPIKLLSEEVVLNHAEIAQDFPNIQTAANTFLQAFGPGFTGTPSGHIATDIAGASSMAGLVVLRSVVTNLDEIKLEPGTAILSDNHAAVADVHSFMLRMAGSMGLTPAARWERRWTKEQEPLLPVEEMTRKLKGAFLQATSGAKLMPSNLAFVAALSAVKLVAAGNETGLLDYQIGLSLAVYYVTAGSKTAPYPSGGEQKISTGFLRRLFGRR